MRRVLLSALLAGVTAVSVTACERSDAAPGTPTESTTSSSAETTTTTTATESSSAAPTTSAKPPTTTTTPKPVAAPPASGGRCTAFPTPACTGVPAGTALTKMELGEGGAVKVTQPGTVIDGRHVPGDLVINADNVVVRNSQIDGAVVNEDGARRQYSYSITDSTVGPASGCLTAPAIGMGRYTATRVHVRGHGDGFRASGDAIRIDDSYVKLCSNPGDHSDGIQQYQTGGGLVINHSTFDQRSATSVTAPIDIMDSQSRDVTITNNLVMGGTYSVYFRNTTGTRVFHNNRVVDKSWIYGPTDADCGLIDWSGNTIVTIDGNYNVTSTVGPWNCK